MEKSLVLIVGGLLLAMASVRAITNETVSDDRNYRVIVDRNPFGLKPPPPPPTNAVPQNVAPKDEILLTGITSIGGLRAYFMTKAPAGKNPEYYSLGVDEKGGGLEVLDIDAGLKSVRVRNAGVESVMSFAANGVKAPATGAGPGPGLPGAPAAPGAMMPNAGGVGVAPGAAPGMTTAGANPSTPNRPVRQIPSRTPRTTTVGPTEPAGAAANPFPAETDVLMMQLQRQANPNIEFPPIPMPPTPGGAGAAPSGPGIPTRR
jgi:hypothetical protein